VSEREREVRQLPTRVPRLARTPPCPKTASGSEYVCCCSYSSSYARSYGVQGLSIFRPVVYGNTAVVLSPEEIRALPPPPPGTRQHTHKWTVALRSAASAPNSDIVGGADDISYYIRRVSFKLHNDYPNSTRSALSHSLLSGGI
jgi:hypothetical protein